MTLIARKTRAFRRRGSMSIAIRNADQLDVTTSRIEFDPPAQRLKAHPEVHVRHR
jgi:hypothetical protein